jgi:hypothetical protein
MSLRYRWDPALRGPVWGSRGLGRRAGLLLFKPELLAINSKQCTLPPSSIFIIIPSPNSHPQPPLGACIHHLNQNGHHQLQAPPHWCVRPFPRPLRTHPLPASPLRVIFRGLKGPAALSPRHPSHSTCSLQTPPSPCSPTTTSASSSSPLSTARSGRCTRRRRPPSGRVRDGPAFRNAAGQWPAHACPSHQSPAYQARPSAPGYPLCAFERGRPACSCAPHHSLIPFHQAPSERTPFSPLLSPTSLQSLAL